MKRLLVIAFLLSTTLPLSAKRATITDFADHKTGDDWAYAIRAALSQCDTLFVPAGKYPCSEVCIPSGRTICGDGIRTVFVALGRTLFRIEGDAGEEIPLIADMKDFSQTMILHYTEGLSAGDGILLVGQRNSMIREDCGAEWTLGRTHKKTCPFGEFLTIESISGDTVRTTTPTIFPSYFKDNLRETVLPEYSCKRTESTVRKIDMARNVHLYGFRIIADDRSRFVVSFLRAEHCSAQNIDINIRSVGRILRAFAITYCKQTECIGCSVEFDDALIDSLRPIAKDGFKSFSRYNIYRLYSSADSGFRDCACNFATNAFNITSNDGHIPSVGCHVIGCRASNAIWSGVIVQQACYNSLLEGNTVTDSARGVVSGGRNTTIRGNKVVCGMPFDTNYFYAHIKRGGTSGIGLFEGYAAGSIIEDNSVEGARTGILILDGYECNNIFTECNITIRRNRTDGCINGFMLYKNKYNTGIPRLDITIENNIFRGGDGHIEATDGSSTFGIKLCSRTNGIIIRDNNISGFNYGVFVSSPAAGIDIYGNTFSDSTYGICTKHNENPRIGLRTGRNTFIRTAIKRGKRF